jgi:flavin-dependent dehydrogenase
MFRGSGLLCNQNGFDVVVFERALHMADRPRDWTILIHWAMPLFKKLLPEHLVEKLPEALCNPGLNFDEDAELLPVYNGETGALLFKSKVPGARRVSRQRLRALLAQDLDDGGGTIRWGKQLAGFSEHGGSGPVQLRFEDGSTYDADFVLGTDGSSSRVRELLFNGDEAARVQLSGFMFASAIMQYGDAAKVEAVVKVHPVAAITMATDAGGGCGGRSLPRTLFV